ncbi:MAG: class I SAM-dependent rRNA methyltransferase [Gemmatimonadetes bacterium]|nr:class I SAM-dependent rRNA methyltransferase [Gemmatimonadota bacterium]
MSTICGGAVSVRRTGCGPVYCEVLRLASQHLERNLEQARVSARGADRWRRLGHPWIYRSDVLEPPAGPPGAVAVVGPRREWLGMALWSPSSQIALRFLAAAAQSIDREFFRERLAAARAYRERLGVDGTAYRLVHGEADGLPSLIVDWYAGHVVVELLSAGLEAYRAELIEALVEVLTPLGILARNDVAVREHEQLPRSVDLLYGQVPEWVEVREGSVRYLAAPWTGQKTGAFLDQRENRQRVGELARGRALDCFAYHGSFTLHLARHADHVTALDTSADALARARVNVELNQQPAGAMRAAVELVEANAFDFLRAQEAAGARYDTIVLDPPAFAKRRGAVERAARGYKEINLRALKLLAPGGMLATFSCSFHVSMPLFRELLESAAADAGRPVRLLEWRGQALDHPEVLQIPESGYLKGAILRVD